MYQNQSPMRDVQDYISLSEATRLLAGIDHPRDRLLVLSLLRTGRRISELLGRPAVGGVNKVKIGVDEKTGKHIFRYVYTHRKDPTTHQFILEGGLKVADIDFLSGVCNFTILKKKGGLTHKVLQADSELLEQWRAWIVANKLKPEDRLFNIRRKRFNAILAKYGTLLNVYTVGGKPIHPHALRHSFAVLAAQNITSPLGIRWIQDNLAHASSDMTMHYLSYNPEESKKILKGMFEGKAGSK